MRFENIELEMEIIREDDEIERSVYEAQVATHRNWMEVPISFQTIREGDLQGISLESLIGGAQSIL